MNKYLFLLIFFSLKVFAFTYEEALLKEKKEGVLKALNTYRVLAKQGNEKAIIHIAKIYFEGKEIQRSIKEAIKWLQFGKKLNYNKSIYYLGKIYLTKNTGYNNPTKAYNNFAIAANNNYAPAQNMIGQFLLSGILVEKDYKKAFKYFEKASKQGYIEANCNIAFMYATGKGVFTNLGRAHVFAKSGIEKGNKRCKKVWKDFKLYKYKKDKGFKFNFYTQPK